jgi:hypothetical protein
MPANASSFRVYTPGELRNVALRPAHLPSPTRLAGGEPEDAALQPMTLLRYLGVGFVATAVLFIGFITIANLTDDTLVTRHDGSSAYASATPSRTTGARAGSPRSAPLPAAAAPVPVNDFELPDDPVPVQRTAVKRGGGKPVKRGGGAR